MTVAGRDLSVPPWRRVLDGQIRSVSWVIGLGRTGLKVTVARVEPRCQAMEAGSGGADLRCHFRRADFNVEAVILCRRMGLQQGDPEWSVRTKL